ncbi:MAG: PEP/pyruvate-binding domain-containing protein [Dehalococcoidales bacterium]|nr:PEP/pyruvate-binding domain-containing protein [Dehalococcoidales bacterium]
MEILPPGVISSGSTQLDGLLQGLRQGDNVVWQIDRLEDYARFADSFAEQAIQSGAACIYLRFAPHPPVVKKRSGLSIVKIDPTPGFDYFSGKVHEIIGKQGGNTYYIFDNLSTLVSEWATDELLANFYQVTCPYIFELKNLAYFALNRGQHGHSTIARIRDTTQILLDVYHIEGNTYIHPLKVWGRYSPQMFLPHLVSKSPWQLISQSGDAASVLAASGKHLVHTVPDSTAPWNSVYRKLMQYKETAMDLPNITPEIAVLKRELSRMMLGNHDKLNKLSDRYLIADDLFSIRERLIGSGQIGGKAVGMLLARRVLVEEPGKIDFSTILEEHDSFYIGSDVFFTFLVNNNLFRLRLQLTKNPQLSREDFEKVEQMFLDGQFPNETMEQFRDMLDYYGQAPIIVRSSSLLEDSFTNAFAGKYRSDFLANQGNPEERMEAFLQALKLVYASALNPDVLSYRTKQGLNEGDEQMAILVQRVSGMPYKKYFFPSLAGVAFSRNLYAWTSRIDPKKGILRLVFGLGTRAVNRVGGDYPRMIALGHPELRPEAGAQIAKYSQRNVDLLDLERNQFSTESLIEVLSGGDYPRIGLMASSMADGYLHDVQFLEKADKDLVLTFDNLIKRTSLVKIFSEMLAKLEKAWEQPVDMEFTAHIDVQGNVKINLLQCRALQLPKTSGADVTPLRNIPRERILFQSNLTISAGVVGDIRYVIYVDPKKYADIESIDKKKSMGRVIGKLNEVLGKKEGRIMLMGPGRWGSTNIDLGINVSYADIDNTAVLVEMAHEKAGYEPEVSYGTHFFQDLVEAEIIYIPIYPNKEAANYNASFFEDSPNYFSEILPDFRSFEDVVRVIKIPSGAQVVVDPKTRNALCFLQET